MENTQQYDESARAQRSYSRGRRARGGRGGSRTAYRQPEQDPHPIEIHLSENKTVEISIYGQYIYVHVWDVNRNKNVALNVDEFDEYVKKIGDIQHAIDTKVGELNDPAY